LLLNRSDQATIAVLLAIGLAAIVGALVYRGYHRGELIEIDAADPRQITFQLDINEAGWPELTLLPGVGETLARRIVRSRDEEGPFTDHDSLLRVKGIGPRTMDAIRPYLLPVADSYRNAESKGNRP
jgi:competence protein ComEA